MGSHAALIARLVETKEGTRELSDEVLVALGWRIGKPRRAWAPNRDFYFDDQVPDPTRNLQDIVDLVPEGHPWTLDSIGIVEMGTTTGKPVEGIAATRALAMCIAILKAVEAGDG